MSDQRERKLKRRIREKSSRKEENQGELKRIKEDLRKSMRTRKKSLGEWAAKERHFKLEQDRMFVNELHDWSSHTPHKLPTHKQLGE